MARHRRIQFPGGLYHVMTRGNEKKDIFRTNEDRKRYVATLERYRRQLEFNLYCYVLMPNHTHLLVETPLGNIAKIMLCINTSYTAYFNKKHDRVGHLFQGRYKSALVDKENYLLELIRYIHLNPVRAGMVERADDYTWSSHRKYLSGEDRTGLLSVESVLSHFGSTSSESIREYTAFINSGLPSDHIEVREQHFIGDDVFIESVSAQTKAERKQSADSRPSRQRARFGDIFRTASKISGLSEEEIRFSRGRNATRTRHVVIWLARRLSGCTLGEIGSYFGGIRWQTVANAVGRVDENQQLRRMADDFLMKLEG